MILWQSADNNGPLSWRTRRRRKRRASDSRRMPDTKGPVNQNMTTVPRPGRRWKSIGFGSRLLYYPR